MWSLVKIKFKLRQILIFGILFYLSWFDALAQDKEGEEKENDIKKEEKKKKKEKDEDEKEDNSPATYTLKSEKEKIFEKKEKLVYSSKTTKYITYNYIKYHTDIFNYRNVTSPNLVSIHRYTLNEKYGNKLQYLGIDGTSVRHIYYQMPEYIGATSGYTNFDLYAIELGKLKLYDTKSPYTYVFIIPMKKHSTINVDYSQNITPLLNIGGSFYYLSNANPFERYPTSKYLMSRNWDLYTHFKSSDEKYQLIASFISMKHYVKESGGSGPKKDSFKYDESDRIPIYIVGFKNINMGYPYNGKPKLCKGSAKNLEIRSHSNLYQQFEVFTDAQIYYEVGWLHSRNSLGEKDGNEKLDNDPKKVKPERSITINNFSNEVGFKSTVEENFFYMIYGRRQDIFRRYDHLLLEKDEIIKKHGEDKIRKHLGENYLGTLFRFNINETSIIETGGEYLFPKHYKIECKYRDEIFDFSIKHSKRKSPFISNSYMLYSGLPDGYKNDEPRELKESSNVNSRYPEKFTYPYPLALQLQGGGKMLFSFVTIRPNLTWTHIGEKYSDFGIYASPGTDMNFKFGDFYWDNSIILSFSIRDNKSKYRMPLLFINSSFYYLNSFFRNKLQIVTGLDLLYKTPYEATRYDFIGHWLFNEGSIGNKIAGYPILDIFINLRYDHFSFFAKISHVNQGIPKSGYYSSPGMPGQRRSYDFGISWYFFD